MKKLSRILFLLFGIVAPIFVGALHTLAHFKDLIRPEVESLLQTKIPIFDQLIPLWDSWGLMSFMMGSCFILIGGLNIGTYSRLAKDAYIPASTLFVMMIYTACAVYGGYTFNAMPQFIGGIVGTLGLSICLLITLLKK